MTVRFLAFLAFLAAAVAAASCGGPGDEPAAGRAPIPVEVTRVETGPLARTFEAGGTVRALTVAPLSSRIVSPILRVHVEPGTRVRRGQPLVTLDARQLAATAATAGSSLQASLRGAAAADAEERGAQAALTLARTTHERVVTLRERNSATAGELDEAVAALRAAEARVDAASARRAEIVHAISAAKSGAEAAGVSASYAVITAPFDGLITEKRAEAGTMAAPGLPLITIEDTSRYRLEVSVDAARAGAIRVGASVPVQVAGLSAATGTVAQLTESLDPAAHTFIVKIDLPSDPSLRSGLFGRARFEAGEDDGLAVPADAVVRRGQLAMVFVDQDGTARMRVIHAGAVVGDRVRVLAGLEEGARVIRHPPHGLLDGTPVVAAGGGDPSGTKPRGGEPSGTKPRGGEPSGTKPRGGEPSGTKPRGGDR
jgi:RND family efflux transporter MFP subunit